MTDFNGRVVVVTGGANGMGEATAHTFARAGATVVILDRDTERTPLVEEDIRRQGGKVSSIVMDLREEDQVRDTIARVTSEYGRIDVLDNNAAALWLATEDGALADLDPALFLETLRGDLLPNFLMTKYTLPVMLERGAGSIINIASISGMAGERTLTAYGVAKAGVIQLTRATAVQYGKQGIRCNAIAPAYVTTRNNEQYAPAELHDIYLRNMLTERTTAPQDIANLALFLGSDESANMTGHVIPVDGGIMGSSPIVADFRDWQNQN